MTIYNTLKNIILEAVSRTEVFDAIEKHRTIRIWYNGDETEKTGWRWIEPYVYGLSKRGNPIVRAYQVQGVTDTEQPGWKTFRVDKISRWEKIPKFFYKPISDPQRKPAEPKYNDRGDDGMIIIYKQGKFQ